VEGLTMSTHAQYAPGPASGARVEKGEDLWTLILVRELRHPPAMVWEALTDPAQLSQWAPFEVDGNLGAAGNTVKLTWVGTGRTTEATVTRAEEPSVLELQNMRWELEPLGQGTRLTLWHAIDRRFVAWGAAGWHIAFDVLNRLLAGDPIERLAGPDAMQFEGWQRLTVEYAQQFGATLPKWPPKAAQKP
jgi:uncharacterized protein YndB with AHSA1/START domain